MSRWAKDRWLAGLDVIDFYFFVLRLLSIVGGYAWLLAAPLAPEVRLLVFRLLLGYALYSGLLYAAILRWPRNVRWFYLTGLAIDMVFVFSAIHYVGQLQGSFYTALYLLVAIPAFYFGLVVGLAASTTAAVLYVGLYFFGGGPGIFPPSDLALRLAFLFLIAGSLGLLAERERRYLGKIEGLNRELSHRNFVLEQFYRYLSLGRIAGGIAERINNPLGVIALRAEILAQDAKEHQLPARFIAGLELIGQRATQAATVTKALLGLARRGGELTFAPIDLNDVVEGTLLLIEHRSAEQGVNIRKDLAPVVPPMRGDARGLREAFLNIVNNAVDAMPEGGTIRVTTAMRDGTVECTIADDGVGIPKEQIEHIFEPFFTTKAGTGGIGLGLFRSLGIIRGHQGIVAVESEPGMGTTFNIIFPVAPPGR
ncbi:MAG: sensor histidine kinase [Candidatus Methylomirabilales bacterium]